mmetsp:Transcript_116686/g.293486  ORF Transcript_116686/g.293486 Transcript_116686/m.293486 type:complete len:202 (+) Transcript_116686:504-1109(+)
MTTPRLAVRCATFWGMTPTCRPYLAINARPSSYSSSSASLRCRTAKVLSRKSFSLVLVSSPPLPDRLSFTILVESLPSALPAFLTRSPAFFLLPSPSALSEKPLLPFILPYENPSAYMATVRRPAPRLGGAIMNPTAGMSTCTTTATRAAIRAKLRDGGRHSTPGRPRRPTARDMRGAPTCWPIGLGLGGRGILVVLHGMV